jgi:hypothetical protein
MKFYHKIPQNKSQVLVLDITSNTENPYEIQYQYMEKEGEDLESFYQSRSLTEKEFEELMMAMDIQFNEQQVPDFIRENFYDKFEVEYQF